MDTTTITTDDALQVSVSTKRRTPRQSDVILRFGDDDPIVIGTISRSIDGTAWTSVTESEYDRVTGRHKASVVLVLARAVGSKYFKGPVRYTYGARSAYSGF